MIAVVVIAGIRAAGAEGRQTAGGVIQRIGVDHGGVVSLGVGLVVVVKPGDLAIHQEGSHLALGSGDVCRRAGIGGPGRRHRHRGQHAHAQSQDQDPGHEFVVFHSDLLPTGGVSPTTREAIPAFVNIIAWPRLFCRLFCRFYVEMGRSVFEQTSIFCSPLCLFCGGSSLLQTEVGACIMEEKEAGSYGRI